MSSSEFLPDHFEASIGGYPGPFYSIRWDGQQLHYRARMDEDELNLVVMPDARSWQTFWQAANQFQLWTWKHEYPDPGCLDGTQWSVTIDKHDQQMIAKGSNAFPGEQEEEQATGIPGNAFTLFCRAIRRLTKQKFS